MTLTITPSYAGAIQDTDIEKTLGNVVGTLIYSGLVPSIGTGLNVNVASGTALIEGHYVNDSAGSAVSVPNGTSSSIWLQMLRNISGYVTSAQYTVAASPPADSAYICDFTSAGGAVTVVTDKRAYNVATDSFGNVFVWEIDGSSQLGLYVSGVEKLFFDTSGNFVLSTAIKSTMAQTTLTGTTAGSIIWTMLFQGASFKKWIGYCNGYENTTGAAQTIVFPTAFSYAPTVVPLNSGSVGSPATFSPTASTTTLTLPTSMGAPVTGWIVCEGY